MMAWILSIIFVPFIAVPFYFLIGIRKRESKHQKEYLDPYNESFFQGISFQDNHLNMFSTLEQNGLPPTSGGHSFELITNAEEAYHTLLDEIHQAKYSIDICSYVFVFDITTDVIYDALVKKVHEGVKVRLLLDTVGSLGVYFHQKAFRSLRKAGGEVAFFTSLTKRPYLNYISLRNHRKMYIFDHRKVLSGGMNLSNDYMGNEDGYKRYKDLLYRLQGPYVEYFYHIFHSDWVYAVKEEQKPQIPTDNTYEGEDIVQVVPSGPDISRDALYETLLNTIYNAKKRIWIVTPYFVPDEHIMQALIIAHRKGVDVKLVTAKESDHFFVDLVRMPYIRQLDKLGVDVLLHEGALLHAKAMIIDDVAAMVGTVNMDNRSLFFNYEIVTFVYTKNSIMRIESWVVELISDSSRGIDDPGKIREAFENIMKVFAPIL